MLYRQYSDVQGESVNLKERIYMTQAKYIVAAFASAAALCAAPFASAQSQSAQSPQSQSGMITVDISGVSTSLAKNLSVDAAQVPATVQVPVGVAAKACGVAANVLTQQGGSGTAGTCQAKVTDTALEQLVQKEMKMAAPEKK